MAHPEATPLCMKPPARVRRPHLLWTRMSRGEGVGEDEMLCVSSKLDELPELVGEAHIMGKSWATLHTPGQSPT